MLNLYDENANFKSFDIQVMFQRLLPFSLKNTGKNSQIFL